TVHGNQSVVKFRCEFSDAGGWIYFYPFAQKRLQPGEAFVRKSKLEAENDRHCRADECPENSGDKKLAGNYFMILTKNIGRQKTGFVFILLMMLMKMIIITIFFDQLIEFRSLRR